MNPARAARLADEIARRLPADVRDAIDVVKVSPAMGGIIIGHEMDARSARTPSSLNVPMACSAYGAASASNRGRKC